MADPTPSVLIVGAGPTGLTLAIELARRGVPHRIIERELELHEQSRATDIQARTLEVFHDIGVLEAALAAGRRRETAAIRADGRLLVRLEFAEADMPYRFGLGLAQHETQRILEARLEQLGGRVERGVRLAGLRQTDASVTTTLLRPDQTYEEPSFAWVVGCDGARSLIRRTLGIPFDGTTFEESFFLVDVVLDSPVRHEELLLLASPNGMTVVGSLAPGPYVRVMGDLDHGFEDELDDAACVELIRARLGDDVAIASLGWRSVFRVNTRMVDRYREGRVLLCGDAAHIHSPITGHGMNCGIQDAYNLGWKLGLVASGRASERLLDSYQAERQPIARTLLGKTDIQTRLMLSRNRVAHGVMAALGQLAFSLDAAHQRILASAVELDVNYPDSPIVGEQRESMLFAPILRDHESEAASVADVRTFNHGPGPGFRAPDLPLERAGTSVFELLRGVEHSLLLFDGLAPTEGGYQNLAAIANAVADRWPDLIRVHVIVLGDELPAGLDWSGSVILDADAALHRRYGATAESLVLIRPDGYVGYRSQPATLAAVARYMGVLLR